MNALSNAMTGDTSPLKKLELALQKEATGGKSKKDADFKEAYELIEHNLTLKVPHKVVLAQFNTAYGHMMHPPRFRKMLDTERIRRSESGDVAMCSACGQRFESAANAISTKEIE